MRGTAAAFHKQGVLPGREWPLLPPCRERSVNIECMCVHVHVHACNTFLITSFAIWPVHRSSLPQRRMSQDTGSA